MRRWHRRIALACALALTTAVPPGHAAAQVADPAARITAAEIARDIAVIADDSMLGRDTPSRGLELTAQYVAGRFQASGLQLFRDGTSFVRRYRIPLRFDVGRSQVVFSAGGQKAVAGFTAAARLQRPAVPVAPVQTNVVLVTGLYTLASNAVHRVKEQIQGKTMLYVVPAGSDTAAQRESIGLLLYNTRSKGMVILSAEDSATFAEQVQLKQQQPIVSREWQSHIPEWSVQVRPEAAPGLTPLLAAAGVDLAQARADTVPRARELPAMGVVFEPRLQGTLSDTATAPNVIGVLEGSDSLLKYEHIVVTAHMDGSGVSPGKADSIRNGYDDNASGTAGLMALAKAFGQSGQRLKRSLVFVATSGGAKPESWGSRAVAMTANRQNMEGKVMFAVVAALNLDGIGRDAKDSLWLGGLGEVKPALPLEWVTAAHPELPLTVVDGGTIFSGRSDHFPFAREGVPSLYFHRGMLDAARGVDDTPAVVDAEEAARVARFIYYLTKSIADADSPPRLNAEGMQRLVGGRVE